MSEANLGWAKGWNKDVAGVTDGPAEVPASTNATSEAAPDRRIAVPSGIRRNISGHDLKAPKPYDIYKYEVFKFASYDLLKKSNENKAPVAAFELTFSSQRIAKDGPYKGRTLPDILYKEEREAEVRVLWKNIGVKRVGKFAVQLYTPGKKGRVDGRPQRRVLIYGRRLKNQSHAIFIHRWGPSGSHGCATSPNPLYSKSKNDNKSGLIKLETYIRESLGIFGKGDTARFVIPGTDVQYPTYSPFEVWEAPEVELDFEIPLDEIQEY